MDDPWNLARSPFVSLIGTNHVPSAAEIANLKAFLVEPQRERSRLESEVLRLQALLERNRKYVEAHQDLLSPIRQLSSELLAEIFTWCLPSDVDYPVRSLKQAPLILTTICRDWRTVAIGTPQLWDSIHVHLPPHLNPDEFAQREAGISLWLERSGSLPLSISLHARTSHISRSLDSEAIDSQMRKTAMSCIRLFMKFSDRIMDLSLSLSLNGFSVFDELPPSHFEILRSLTLRDASLYEGVHNHLEEGPVEFSPTSLLNRMPVLKTLKVKDFLMRSNSTRSFGVGSLTSIDLSAGSSNAFGVTVTVWDGLSILAQSPQVQFVKMNIQLGHDTDFPLSTVHLDQLNDLHLAFSVRRMGATAQAQMITLFNNLQSPSLKSLSVSWRRSLIDELPFHNLPLHALENLELDVVLKPDVLFECLTLVPNLLSLQLKTTEFSGPWISPADIIACSLQDNHVLSLTLSPQNTAPLCPHLQKFQFINKLPDNSGTISTATLTNFIKSRGSTLKECDIFFADRPSFTDRELDHLQQLKQAGLKLRLHYGKPFVPQKLDVPTIGLLPYRLYLRSLTTSRLNSYDIPDMEGPYGTEVIL